MEVIRGIVEGGEVGPNGGLRISGASEGNGETALDFKLASQPAAGDEIVREGGAVLFLDETAASVMTGKTLDVRAHGDHFHFSLDEEATAS